MPYIPLPVIFLILGLVAYCTTIELFCPTLSADSWDRYSSFANGANKTPKCPISRAAERFPIDRADERAGVRSGGRLAKPIPERPSIRRPGGRPVGPAPTRLSTRTSDGLRGPPAPTRLSTGAKVRERAPSRKESAPYSLLACHARLNRLEPTRSDDAASAAAEIA